MCRSRSGAFFAHLRSIRRTTLVRLIKLPPDFVFLPFSPTQKLGLDTYLEQAEALAAQDAKELGATKKVAHTSWLLCIILVFLLAMEPDVQR